MQVALDGIYLGLTLALLLGPIFIVLLQTSIEHGWRAGLLSAAGIWISDLMIVSITLIFVKRIKHFVENPQFIFWMGLIGGAVLIGVGTMTAIKKSTMQLDSDIERKKTHWSRHLLSGFLVNTINPFTFIFWLTTITSYVATHRLSNWESYIFAIAILSMIVTTDTVKVVAAKYIRPHINDRSLTLINKIAGSALIIFGFVLLFRSVYFG